MGDLGAVPAINGRQHEEGEGMEGERGREQQVQELWFFCLSKKAEFKKNVVPRRFAFMFASTFSGNSTVKVSASDHGTSKNERVAAQLTP